MGSGSPCSPFQRRATSPEVVPYRFCNRSLGRCLCSRLRVIEARWVGERQRMRDSEEDVPVVLALVDGRGHHLSTRTNDSPGKGTATVPCHTAPSRGTSLPSRGRPGAVVRRFCSSRKAVPQGRSSGDDAVLGSSSSRSHHACDDQFRLAARCGHRRDGDHGEDGVAIFCRVHAEHAGLRLLCVERPQETAVELHHALALSAHFVGQTAHTLEEGVDRIGGRVEVEGQVAVRDEVPERGIHTTPKMPAIPYAVAPAVMP